MDKRIRKSKGTNRRLTCSKGGHSHLIMFNQTGWERKKKKREKEREGKGRRSRERSSTFSLDFPTIGLSVPNEARGKVLPRGKSFK